MHIMKHGVGYRHGFLALVYGSWMSPQWHRDTGLVALLDEWHIVLTCTSIAGGFGRLRK
jgi:hypothetical protein